MRRRITNSLALRLALAMCLLVSPLTFTGCSKSDLHKLHDSLNKAAKSLNAAAKTNRAFYEGGIYGPVGSQKAQEMRAKAATVIHEANEHLITSLKLAQGLTEATFEQGKLAVLQALAAAGANLRTGNQNIDLVLAAVATLINQAVVLIEAFQSYQLKYVLPEIRTWRIAEVTA